MGMARSRMKKVAPVSVTEETVCSDDSDRDGHLSSSDTSVVRIVSIRKRDRTDCNSEGQESEVSAEDDTLAEVDRILAECENIDNNMTSHKMPTLGSKSPELCYAKRHASNDLYRDSKHDELQHAVCVKNDDVNNTMNKLTSNIQEQISPPKDPLCSTDTESTATALCHGTGISSLPLPITYDASEEDLMDTIEREFG